MRMNFGSFSAALIFFPLILLAGNVPEEFDKNSVQFVFSRSGTNFSPSGTCFTITVPTPLKDAWWRYLIGARRYYNFPYIVTSKHVLFDETGKLRTDLYWRVSNVGGGISYMEITPNTNNPIRILTHSDPSVDVAVFTFGSISRAEFQLVRTNTPLNPSKVGSIPVELLRDKKHFDRNMPREGDEVFFAGLFTPFYGTKGNLPVFRFGRLSMVTDEFVPFLNTSNTISPQRLFLAESQVFGGNSGSPAFFYRNKWRQGLQYVAGNTGSRDNLKGYIYLGGIVKGHFNDWSEVKFVNSVARPVASDNVGIAAIVPAYYLHEIILSKEEKRFRKDFVKIFEKD